MRVSYRHVVLMTGIVAAQFAHLRKRCNGYNSLGGKINIVRKRTLEIVRTELLGRIESIIHQIISISK